MEKKENFKTVENNKTSLFHIQITKFNSAFSTYLSKFSTAQLIQNL